MCIRDRYAATLSPYDMRAYRWCTEIAYGDTADVLRQHGVWGYGTEIVPRMYGDSVWCALTRGTEIGYGDTAELMKIFGLMGTPKDKTLLARSACTQ
eukprot:3622177-Rhodomonas_salina.1